jgi:hypothetical protein
MPSKSNKPIARDDAARGPNSLDEQLQENATTRAQDPRTRATARPADAGRSVLGSYSIGNTAWSRSGGRSI